MFAFLAWSKARRIERSLDAKLDYIARGGRQTRQPSTLQIVRLLFTAFVMVWLLVGLLQDLLGG